MPVHRQVHSFVSAPARGKLLPGLAVAAILLGGCGSTSVTAGSTPTAAPSSASPVSGPQQVSLSEWKVDVPTAIKAGKVTFTIKNAGSIEHELLVFNSDLDASGYPTAASGDIQEDGAGITKLSDGDNVAAGGSQDRIVDLSKPGKYLFVCNLPGHFPQGMSRSVIVTA